MEIFNSTQPLDIESIENESIHKNKMYIETLSHNNSNYNNPEQAITTANLCDTISRDINTDSKRFIFELLQNADDASNQYGKLDVQIDFIGSYIVVSHNGEQFKPVDIESISSAGDGTKAGDSNKTGFKGIGFKSVFSHSSMVIIKSGDYCFKFDKEYWSNHWNNSWGSKNSWQALRIEKSKDENIKMPWQIIPLWAKLPEELEDISVFNQYKVSTVIHYENIKQLKTDLSELFSKSQIVLFLRSKEVKISINSEENTILEKIIDGETTLLKRNGVVLSEWLIKKEQFEIPQLVQDEINADEKSPKKLKEAKCTEISFAIQLENGKLKAADKQNRLVFTYLPTSINFNFPFLVNASFLTDAGRQHLHQDTFWNKWIFKQIPLRYFKWVAELANKNSKYKNHILRVLPEKLSALSALENNFNNGFNEALETIAFIPNIKGELLTLKDAIYDKTKISEFINPQTLINYINAKTQNKFNTSSYISYIDNISALNRLGLETFDVDNLEGFFASEIFENEHQLQDNFHLISFLYKQSQRNNNNEINIWNEKLMHIPFILDSYEKLRTPGQIYFPVVDFSNDLAVNLITIHDNIVLELSSNKHIKSWLEDLGVKEPTDISFIEKTIISEGHSFIKSENAIEVGRYLFNAHKKGLLSNDHYEKLRKVKILTKNNSLISAQECFLSDLYEPTIKLEKTFENDFYVSDDYFSKNDLLSEWKTFFLKINVKDDIQPVYQNIAFNYSAKWKERFDNKFFEQIWDIANDHYWISWSGWSLGSGDFKFSPQSIMLFSLPFLQYTKEYSFSKMYFTRVFSKFSPADIKIDREISVSGSTGMISRSLSGADFSSQNCEVKYFRWVIDNLSIFPVQNNECRKATEIFLNTSENINLAGDYLPILDYDGVISPEWKETLKFKEHFDIDDYLNLLRKISEERDPEKLNENKARVGLIYEKLASMNLHQSEIDKIKAWGISNRLMAKNGRDFYLPSELSVVTDYGFKASNLAYIENRTSDIFELLRIFGVKIIDNVSVEISNSKVEIKDLKSKLLNISPLIALVAVEKSKKTNEWESEYIKIRDKISAITFYETENIILSYGNEEDKQKKCTWAKNNEFYYVGKWYSPRILDNLVEPLGSFFKIRYAERILSVLLLSSFSEGIEYLIEKGLNLSLIPEEFKSTKEEEARTINQGNRTYNQSDEDIGKQGEKFVFKELKRIYSCKYNQPVIETPNGFKIDNKVDVFWMNISDNTTSNHDFKVIEMGNEIFIDSKATTYNKNVEKLALYISGNELELMERADKYLIARVYNATSENPSMELVKLEVECLSD